MFQFFRTLTRRPEEQMAPKFGDLSKKTKDLFADDFGGD